MAVLRDHAPLGRRRTGSGAGPNSVPCWKTACRGNPGRAKDINLNSDESAPVKAQLLTMSTPDGPFTIIAREGTVLASGWTAGPGELTGQIHADLLPDGYEEVADLGPISAAVESFYAGEPDLAMTVPVLQKSGPFRSHAWDVLRTVAPGSPVTYTEYAELSGNSKAVRAAASACAFNAAALFVPCHRVVRTDGSLGGFRWGLAIKERLLARERGQVPAPAAF